MTFHLFGRLILTFILVGSVTTATRVSEAYQFSVTTVSEETISGYILSIDQITGMITVETATGTIKLEAVPEAITAWKEGDLVILKREKWEKGEADK